MNHSIICKKINRKYIILFSLALLICVPLFFYIQMLNHLFIFGDATTQANIARNILENGLRDTDTIYPPTYHVLGAILLLLFDELGFKLLTILGLLLVSIFSFILARKLTNSDWVGLITVLLILTSTKTSFYSARMYMEIFLSAFFIITILYFIDYLQTQHDKSLMLSIFFLGVSITIKQQALVTLLPAMTLSLIINSRTQRDKKVLKIICLYIGLLLFILPMIIWLAEQSGTVLPETDYTSGLNEAIQRIVVYDKQEPLWIQKWDEKLDLLFNQYQEKGYARALDLQIWPWDVIINPDKSYKFHTLYYYSFAWKKYNESFITFILIFFTIGAVLWLRNMAMKKKRILMFFSLFLVFNYIVFLRNTDQMRYQLYIPFLLAFFIPYAFNSFINKSHMLNKKNIRTIMVGLVIVPLVTSTFFIFIYDVNSWKNFARTQAYAGSKGGMPSLIEVSKWIENNSRSNEKMYAIPNNEFEYYSRRDFIFDYRIYFLSEEELQQLFADMNIKYIVIMDSITVPDEKWTHVGWAPKSFVKKIESLYKVAYVSSYGDIRVFKV